MAIWLSGTSAGHRYSAILFCETDKGPMGGATTGYCVGEIPGKSDLRLNDACALLTEGED